MTAAWSALMIELASRAKRVMRGSREAAEDIGAEEELAIVDGCLRWLTMVCRRRNQVAAGVDSLGWADELVG